MACNRTFWGVYPDGLCIWQNHRLVGIIAKSGWIHLIANLTKELRYDDVLKKRNPEDEIGQTKAIERKEKGDTTASTLGEKQ